MMHNTLWGAAFFAAIIFGQMQLEKYQFTLQRADSSARINYERTDRVATDVLQESLYVQLLSEIHNPERSEYTTSPETEFQLLQRVLRVYPNAKLRSDTLVIPYPAQKVKSFKAIKYFIPRDYFNSPSESHALQPEIQLSLNSDKSTLTINRAYRLSYYRAPDINNPSLKQSKKVLDYIFNLLIPYTSKTQKQSKHYSSAIIYYKGYQEHTLKLVSEEQFFAFWESLSGQGSLYFFPAKIDDLKDRLVVSGLLYVMKGNILNVYHFGELKVICSKYLKRDQYKFRLDFYPFVMNKQIGN